jgi:hypothetical protein
VKEAKTNQACILMSGEIRAASSSSTTRFLKEGLPVHVSWTVSQ